MPGNQESGDHMARQKTLEEQQTEREKAEQDLGMRQENLKKLKQKEAELSKISFRSNYLSGMILLLIRLMNWMLK